MANTAFSKACDPRYRAVHDSGKRNIKDITLFVVHVAEAPTARGVAEYFTSKDSGGSTQLVVDSSKCFRCLPNDTIPWGAVGANINGVHCEHAGYASWSRDKWINEYRLTLSRGAYKCAAHCKHLGIRPIFLSALDMLNGQMNGVTTHHQVNVWAIAKKLPGDHTHTCPGVNFPLQHKDDYYMELVHKHYANL